MLQERLQILITPEQRRRLESEASRRGSSVAALVREAIDARFAPVTRQDRLAALEGIRKMNGRAVAPDELDRVAEAEREQVMLDLKRP